MGAFFLTNCANGACLTNNPPMASPQMVVRILTFSLYVFKFLHIFYFYYCLQRYTKYFNFANYLTHINKKRLLNLFEGFNSLGWIYIV